MDKGKSLKNTFLGLLISSTVSLSKILYMPLSYGTLLWHGALAVSFLIGFIICSVNVNGCVIALSFIQAGGELPKAINNPNGSFTSTGELCLTPNGVCQGEEQWLPGISS